MRRPMSSTRSVPARTSTWCSTPLTHPVEADPAEAILNVAEQTGADLIVVGNKGMTGARRYLLGSVPNNISHHAPCSVMIVRTT
jgi:nucleotide-binding universal stress UspA family protein